MDMAEKILDIMRTEGQPLNAGKIAEIGGFERKDVDKAMAHLKKEARIISPKRCYWTPA
ncbi:MAG: MarR family transcriptional regulator [Desulfuromonadales bacterium]|nr:MarR family transcriptional regulator [Desulfuromonadales bacterium]